MCVVPKRFRIKLLPGTSIQGMKLNKKRIRWLVNQKKKGESSDAVAKDMKLSKRRVEQIWKEYRETGKDPAVGKNLGRPEKPITKNEAEPMANLLK